MYRLFSFSPSSPFLGRIIYLWSRGKREYHRNDFSWDADTDADKAESIGVPDGETLSTNIVLSVSSLVLIKSQEKLLLQWLSEVVCWFGRRKFSGCDFNHGGFLVMKFVMSCLKSLRAGFPVALDNPRFQRQLCVAEGEGKTLTPVVLKGWCRGSSGTPKPCQKVSEGLWGQSYFPNSLMW